MRRPMAVAVDAQTTPLLPPEPGYRRYLYLLWGLRMAALALAAILIDIVIVAREGGMVGLLSGIGIAVALLLVATVPSRRFNHLAHAVGGDDLRIVRGSIWRMDTLVPFVRVQHIDVAQSALERLSGIARLIVHTAGTHNSIVTLPGLSPDGANRLRDAIRQHIVTDFE